MSNCNLRQIESAFSTHRDQYAQFETAVTAVAGGCHNPGPKPVTPIIIAEDFSSGKSVQIIGNGVASGAGDGNGDTNSNAAGEGKDDNSHFPFNKELT